MLDFHSVNEDMVVGKIQDTKFLLLPTQGDFDYPEPENDEDQRYCLENSSITNNESLPPQPDQKYPIDYCRLWYNGKLFEASDLISDIRPSIPAAEDASTKGDLFLPVGRLVETKHDRYQDTNYIFMLSLSTRPVSMWIAFNYVFFEEDWEIGDPSEAVYIYSDDIAKSPE